MSATLMVQETIPDAPAVQIPQQAFVVLHAGLGQWKRGDVLTQADLPLDELNRHLGLKSVRLAYPAEAVMKHVQLPDDTPSISYEQRLAEKDQQIMSLHAQLRDAHEQVQRATPMNNNVLTAERESHSALIAQKDKQFTDLHTRWRLLDSECQKLAAQNRKVEQELIEANGKLALMESASQTPSNDELRSRIAAVSGQVPPGSDAASVEARKNPKKS